MENVRNGKIVLFIVLMETQSDFPKSQMYKGNIFKKSVVQRVGWDPSLNLE